MLSEKARKQRNEYIKEWRRKNPERAAAITKRYWEKKVAELEAAAENEGGCKVVNLDSDAETV